MVVLVVEYALARFDASWSWTSLTERRPLFHNTLMMSYSDFDNSGVFVFVIFTLYVEILLLQRNSWACIEHIRYIVNTYFKILIIFLLKIVRNHLYVSVVCELRA